MVTIMLLKMFRTKKYLGGLYVREHTYMSAGGGGAVITAPVSWARLQSLLLFV